MKRTFFVITAIILLSGLAGAQNTDRIYLDPFVPISPEVIGQGGSFTAVASGYNSLFTNPAGFGSEKGSLTIISANPWVYYRPDALVETVSTIIDSGGDDLLSLIPGISEQITTGGMGIGVSTGLAWTGKGLGLGVVGTVDSYIYGDTLLGAEGEATATVGLIGGLAVPINILGITLTVGGDVRPMYRAYIPMDNELIIMLLSSLSDDPGNMLTLLMAESAYAGIGLGLDVGAMLDLGPFTLGLSIRDLFGTPFHFYGSSLEGIVASLENGDGFPRDEIDSEDAYYGKNFVIPMEISLGGAWHPDLGGFSFILDPTFHIDLKDPLPVFRGECSPWNLLHIGAEAKMFRFISLRAGLNQGYITAGFGMKILFIDVNASIFTLERGLYTGDRPNSGVALEAALRF